MIDALVQLIVLFAVIFDPLASLVVFVIATASMEPTERRVTASLALLVAAGLSFIVLILGPSVLTVLNTSIDEFRVAGGIVLGILGLKMALGLPIANTEGVRGNSAKAIAALIGTPLLTGPATITTIIVTVTDYGAAVTGLAIAIVLAGTAVLFYNAERITRKLGHTAIQVTSTILGLVTLAWGVKFVAEGLLAIIR